MPAPSTATADEIRSVNTRYHDGAAGGYDAKWGIDYGEVGRGQVLGKVRKALGGRGETFDRSLEAGAGTGYFSLNLLRAGRGHRLLLAEPAAGGGRQRGGLHRHLTGHAARARGNAAELGVDVETAA